MEQLWHWNPAQQIAPNLNASVNDLQAQGIAKVRLLN
jgi:hypothetical protein